jgi:hypothetical protein
VMTVQRAPGEGVRLKEAWQELTGREYRSWGKTGGLRDENVKEVSSGSFVAAPLGSTGDESLCEADAIGVPLFFCRPSRSSRRTTSRSSHLEEQADRT